MEHGSIAGEIVQNNSLITVSNATIATSTIVYKVQLIASAKNIPLLAKNFKGLSTITSRFDNEIYRYMYGETTSLEAANKLQLEARMTK